MPTNSSLSEKEVRFRFRSCYDRGLDTDHQRLIELDRQFVWHPFTPNDVWLDAAFSPVVIAEGEGAVLIDTEGKRYLDGNASIWTNLHGHRHPKVHQAIRDQLDRIAHSSFLGLTNEKAPLLAERLCRANGLDRCFFSDDGSTAMEAALKMVIQFLQQNGQKQRTRIVSLASAYHGDTVGAMSMGHSDLFHHTYRPLLFPSSEAMLPGCYRCPFNRAQPEQADARTYRKCNWECIDELEQSLCGRNQQEKAVPPAALVMEPRVQGPAGFVMHPEGYLKKAAGLARDHGARLILDEVMVGFGRTGSLFAHQKEEVEPDIIALAKGITNGTLPLAATLCRDDIFQGFGGEVTRTFFHGHSYTGNQLGCAAALASLDLLESDDCSQARRQIEIALEEVGARFWKHPKTGDVRREGCILAIEVVKDPETREAYPYPDRVGAAICKEAESRGLITRPVGDVLLLMPPYAATAEQIETMGKILMDSLLTVLPARTS